MQAQEERRVKRLLRRLLGVAQGLKPKHGGGRLLAFCKATGRKYATVANKLNLGTHEGRPGKGLAVVDVGLLVDACRYLRDTRPVQLLRRIVEGRRQRRQERHVEVAA